jgi:hypothetical protein
MPPPDDRSPAPPIQADPPAPNLRRIVMIALVVVLVLAVGVALHM